MTELQETGDGSVAREPIRLEAAEGYRKLIGVFSANRLLYQARTLEQIFPHLAEYVNGPDLIGGGSYRREFTQGLRDGDEEVITVLAWSMWHRNNTQKSHIKEALHNMNNVRNNSDRGESSRDLKERKKGLTAENKRLKMVAHLMESQMRVEGLESRAHFVAGGGLKLEDFFKREGTKEQVPSAIARALQGVNLDPTRRKDS